MNVLEKIVATKHIEIAQRKTERPERELRAAVRDAPAVRDFFAPLAAPGCIKLIAEVKKASPSKGVIRQQFDPVAAATEYATNGATCISVLTDEHYFQGKLADLSAIREACPLPLLRKDFLLDRYQLLEARVAGADAVLLIAECLDDCRLRALHHEALELGLTPLVEFYEPQNLPRVLEAGAMLVGVNNRNLQTFDVNLAHVIDLRAQIPEDVLLVAESGIHSRADVLRLEQAGIHAMLVGERLMAAANMGAAVRELLGRE
jgi:indole-3-glycerol phosphate synthase